MIDLLVYVIIVLVVIGLLYWLVTMLPLPAPIKQIVTVLIVIICIIWVLYMFAPLLGSGPHFHISR